MVSTNIEHMEEDRSYEHDLTNSRKNCFNDWQAMKIRAHKARENMGQEVNDDRTQGAYGKYEETYDEVLIELNNVKTKQECPLNIEKKSHLIHEFCAQNQSRFYSKVPYNVPQQYILNFDSPCTLIYHAFTFTTYGDHSYIIHERYQNTMKMSLEFESRKISRSHRSRIFHIHAL